jgi:gag-polypeptide of LTR copia-type
MTLNSPNSILPEATSNSIMSFTSSADPIVILNIPISTRLNRNNFLSWKSQIISALHGHGLYHFLIDIAHEENVSVEGVQQSNPFFSRWHRQDQLILSWPRSTLSDTILSQVVSCDTSATLWKSLLQSFSATSRARLSELRRALQTTTKEGLSCADYCQKMKSLADEFAFVGSPISDDDLVFKCSEV